MKVLQAAKSMNPDLVTKSSIMLGLGETDEQVRQTLVGKYLIQYSYLKGYKISNILRFLDWIVDY